MLLVKKVQINMINKLQPERPKNPRNSPQTELKMAILTAKHNLILIQYSNVICYNS